MITEVIASKIPKVWNQIKFAVTQADGAAEGQQGYLNELLHSLMSSKTQCLVLTDAKRSRMKAIIITKMLVNQITKKKYLLLRALYAFEKLSDKEWAHIMTVLADLGKQGKCSYISFFSGNARIFELAKIHGFQEKQRGFEFKIGG